MSISPSLEEMQARGFPVGGEPSVAMDLVDTVTHAHTAPTDLMAAGADAWWTAQSGRLPEWEQPDVAATSRLRTALREVFEASIDGRAPSDRAVDELNRFAESALGSPAIEVVDGAPRMTTHWHIRRDGSPRLAAIAGDAIALIGDPARRAQLRRCANPTCSMLFVAENPRRVWCAPNICGNRARVARHQQRHNAGN